MSSTNKCLGPISCLFLFLGIAGTFAMTICMPAAELIPAQIFPEIRTSGESCVRDNGAMAAFAGLGLKILDMVPKPQLEHEEDEHEVKSTKETEDPLTVWEARIIKDNGEKYGKEVISNIENTLGGKENVKTIVSLVHLDKNFVYNLYALFLGIAMLAGAIAIQAVGRYDSEEKTILPLKK